MLVAQGLGLLPLEFERLGQPRQEMGEIVVPPGFFPGALAQHGRPRKLLDETLRQLDFLIDLPLDSADGDGRFAIRLGRQRPGGQFGHLAHERLVGPALMDQAGKERGLFGAILGVGGRHLRPLVPFQDGAGGDQQRSLANVPANVIENSRSGLRHGVFLDGVGVEERIQRSPWPNGSRENMA